jgi:iron complex outermembrane receptor protein
VRIAGNPNFKPEELVGYEAGYRGVLTPQLYVDVSVYYNNHHNLESLGALSTYVETSPAPPHVVLQFPYTNGILGNSRGIEIAPDWRPVRFWQLKGSYSYLRIDVENQPGNADTSGVATYEGSSPRHQVLVRSMLDLPRGWEFDQTIRSASALPAQKVDAYTAIDLRLGWQLARQLSLSITGENLTDANHVEFGHAPPPSVGVPRSLYAAIAWNR